MVDIALNRQIQIYSVDTNVFYNEKEEFIHNHLNRRYFYKNELNKKKRHKTRIVSRMKKKIIDDKALTENEKQFRIHILEKSLNKSINKINLEITTINKSTKYYKNKIK